MNWNISQIDQGFQDGKLVPVTAHWQCTHTDGDLSASVYSTASVSGLQEEVSTESVLAHIWANGVDKEATEKACVNQIAAQRIAAGALRLEGVISAPVPATPLDQAKASAQAQIDDHHAAVVTNLVGAPTQTEKDTWAMKLETASSVASGIEPSIAGKTFLVSAGIITQESQQAWANLVIQKSAIYAGIVGVGEKLRSAARQAIKQAGTVEEVNSALQASIVEAETTVKAFLQR
jgi:hypothetical protein